MSSRTLVLPRLPGCTAQLQGLAGRRGCGRWADDWAEVYGPLPQPAKNLLHSAAGWVLWDSTPLLRPLVVILANDLPVSWGGGQEREVWFSPGLTLLLRAPSVNPSICFLAVSV